MTRGLIEKLLVKTRSGHGSVNHINRTEPNQSVEIVQNNRTEPFKIWNEQNQSYGLVNCFVTY